MPEILSIGELLDLGNSAATAGLIPYSALEYDGTGRVSGISGSAIAGVDSAVVSSIVSSYVESGVSGKVDRSAFDDCCSSVQSALSGKLDASASGQFQPSGDYYSASNPSGFITTADLSGKIDASASSQFQPSGNYVYESSFSSFSSETTGNISSLSSMVSAISGQTGYYVEKSSISAESAQWNEVSGLSGKLDSSASSSFYPMSGNPSGFLTEADVSSSYIPVSALETDENSAITGISGSSIGGVTGDYVEKSAYHLQIGTGNTVLPSTSNPTKGTWAVIGSGNNMSRSGSALPNNDVSHVLIGQNNSATVGTAIALGVSNSAQGSTVNILIGKYNQSYSGGDYAAAIGYGAVAEVESVSIGQRVTATNYSVAIGKSAAAVDQSLVVQPGLTTRASASSNSYAIGHANSAFQNSVAIGQLNSAASASLSVGFLNTATKSSHLYGHGLIGDSDLTVLGRWNSASAGSGNTAFVFGDGSGGGNKRHDLMLLLRSGDIVINGSSNSGVSVVKSITGISSTISSHMNSWNSVTARIPLSALKYEAGTTTITAIYNSAIGGGVGTGVIPYSALEYSAGSTTITAISGSSIGSESLNTAALVAGAGISIDLSGDGNYYINNTNSAKIDALPNYGISSTSYINDSGQEIMSLGLNSSELYQGTQFRYAIQSSFPASAYEQEVPLVANQGMPYGYTSYTVKLDAIVSCPYGATWSLVEFYNNTWDASSASAVIALDRTEGGNSSMVHLRGETLAGGNNASARLVNVMVKFDEAPVGNPTVTVHDQVGYFVRIPQGRIANAWWA